MQNISCSNSSKLRPMGNKMCFREMFLTWFENKMFASEAKNMLPQHVLLAWLNWDHICARSNIFCTCCRFTCDLATVTAWTSVSDKFATGSRSYSRSLHACEVESSWTAQACTWSFRWPLFPTTLFLGHLQRHTWETIVMWLLQLSHI